MNEMPHEYIERRIKEIGLEAADLVSRADREVVVQMIKCFRQNTHNVGVTDVINDPEGFVFFDAMTKIMWESSYEIRSNDNLTPEQKRKANIFWFGMLAGVYLAELGKAKVIFREK